MSSQLGSPKIIGIGIEEDLLKRLVMELGQSWDEMCLFVQPFGGTTMIWISKIDPKTHLPQTFRVKVADTAELVKNLLEARLDYPSEGPLTLDALGVPDDATLEDRAPKDSLKNRLARMKEQRMKLGPTICNSSTEIHPEFLENRGRIGQIAPMAPSGSSRLTR